MNYSVKVNGFLTIEAAESFARRMLDEGFKPEISRILPNIPPPSKPAPKNVYINEATQIPKKYN